jgi:hypothetical protein
MAKAPRVKRTKSDLLVELREQVVLLQTACASFDSGLKPIGKHISLSLRVLLHHHGQSQALLYQLRLRDKQFFDSAGDLDPNNLLTENPLCFMRIGATTDYMPALAEGPFQGRWLPFDRWWNNGVIRDDKRRVMNRSELILNVADTDGGAHVDPALDVAYMDLSRNNSLGWMIGEGDVRRPFPPPVMACIRQIAHEVLTTLRKKAPEESEVTYAI